MTATAYCDLNFLINLGLGKEAIKSEFKKRVADGEFTFVISPWHLIEMARGNHPRGAELADFVDSICPLWIYERRDLQKHEVHEQFFAWLGIEYHRPPALTTREEVLAELNGVPVARTRGVVSRDFVVHLQAHPEAWAPIETAHKSNVSALEALRKASADGKLTTDIRQKADIAILKLLVPTETPSGLSIDSETLRSFFKTNAIKNCKSITVEVSISEDGWRTVHNFTWNDFMDRQHAICALPYVDFILTDDGPLTDLVKRLQFKFPIACPASKKQWEDLILKSV